MLIIVKYIKVRYRVFGCHCDGLRGCFLSGCFLPSTGPTSTAARRREKQQIAYHREGKLQAAKRAKNKNIEKYGEVHLADQVSERASHDENQQAREGQHPYDEYEISQFPQHYPNVQAMLT